MTNQVREAESTAQVDVDQPNDYGLKIRYPKLRLSFYSAIASDTLLFYSDGEENVWLKGPLVITLLPQLLPLLSGTLTIDQIIQRIGTDLRQEILGVLKHLKDQRLIEEGQLEPEAYVPAEYLAQHQEQLTFFGHFHQQPLRAQQHLYTSRVTLLDDGTAYGPQLASALAATGPGELRLVNAADQGWLELANRTLDDVAAPEELARQLAEQQPFSQISAHRLSYEWVPSPTEITPPRGTDQTYQALTPLTNGASLVVVLTEGYSSRLCDIVNELALKEGFRWLNVSLKGSRVYVGPGIVPHTTACWLCYHSRVWANQVQPNTPYGIFEEAEQAYHTHATRRTFGQLPAVTNLAAALGANEIVKALTLYSQALYGSVLAFDAFNNRSQTYEVLRLPRCKACGRDRVRVPMKLWHTSRPVVRSING